MFAFNANRYGIYQNNVQMNQQPNNVQMSQQNNQQMNQPQNGHQMNQQNNQQMNQPQNGPQMMRQQQPINPPMEIQQQPPIINPPMQIVQPPNNPPIQIGQPPINPEIAENNPDLELQDDPRAAAVRRFTRYNIGVVSRANGINSNQSQGLVRFRSVPQGNNPIMGQFQPPFYQIILNRQENQWQRMRQYQNQNELHSTKNYMKYILMGIFVISIFLYGYLNNTGTFDKVYLVGQQNIDTYTNNDTQNLSSTSSSANPQISQDFNNQKIYETNYQSRQQTQQINIDTKYNISLDMKSQNEHKLCQCDCNKFQGFQNLSNSSIIGMNSSSLWQEEFNRQSVGFTNGYDGGRRRVINQGFGSRQDGDVGNWQQ